MAEWIYTSPDGGETVYKHKAGVSEKILVSQTEKAQAERFALSADKEKISCLTRSMGKLCDHVGTNSD